MRDDDDSNPDPDPRQVLISQLLPEHEIILVESAWEGIYGLGGTFRPSPDIYIILDGGKTTVEHQYGCVGCSQFKLENAALFAVNGPLAREVDQSLICYPDEERVLAAIRAWLPDAEISSLSEGLVLVQSESLGCFHIAAVNCD